eukprot:CAMPEP_0194132748 /NCGR_PEP_ID=MMETSP0152-20130528/3148_1 /TAXON_ID=1049557 /ORGANISM="Thalassiothrix antarctica, Strain L6-D1" /LENGTH=277 /DNA_ID=CAMNT_0038827907 /DNA_START=366 /DNA_END=1199 /DNA_ORIENTATION=-
MGPSSLGPFLRYQISPSQISYQAAPFLKFIDGTKGFSNTWSEDLVTVIMLADSNGRDISVPHYPGSNLQIREALHLLSKALLEKDNPMKPQKVLVAGSISPWIEALVLNSDLKLVDDKVYVTDYNPLEIEDPRIEFILMDNLKSSYFSPDFDIILSFSSIEHDGLGRYGDPINPRGDIAAVAEYHAMLKENGSFILGLPMVCSDEQHGTVVGNAHRIFSLERLSKMTCGFDVVGERIDPLTLRPVNGIRTCVPDWQYQPVFTLKKTKGLDCYMEILP